MKENINQACVAYFAVQLMHLAADFDKFENAFVDTDLGGSQISLERGLESLYTDDYLYNTEDADAERHWGAAWEYVLETVSEDERLNDAADRFNSRDEDKQWTGSGPRGTQRALLAAARKVLTEASKPPALTPESQPA